MNLSSTSLIAATLLMVLPLQSSAGALELELVLELETAVKPAYLYEISAPARGIEAVVWHQRTGVLTDSLELVTPLRLERIPEYSNDLIYAAVARKPGKFRIRLEPQDANVRLRVEQSVFSWVIFAGQGAYSQFLKSGMRGPWRLLPEVDRNVFELLPGGEIHPKTSREALVAAWLKEGGRREAAEELIPQCGAVYTCAVLERVELRLSVIASDGAATEIGTISIFQSQLT